ncbi:Hypothetical protein NTJ_12652 [Nesidiocoris tenuis]|uniref:Uncharacterized protein n=1 Tax=Nesidiocoris tenuis TaxID=355587 RepID=A0ABN7B602_9HEMI|nr:Hypothetical protein NTJ_12652 [Nesidiocoris tenuis]
MLIVFINVAVIFHYLPIILNSDGPDSETGPLQDPPVEDSLVKVTFIFRHGDRGPLKSSIDSLPAHSDEWPDGYGELTKVGKMNAYLLGQRLRSRYDKILTPYYKSSNFRAISTRVERAMMSANLVLAGLYPPQDHQKWSEEINWAPIPVHPSEMSGEFFNCNRLHHEVITSLRNFGPEQWQALVKFLQEKNEKIVDTERPIKEIISRYDTAMAKIRSGKPLEHWEAEFAELSTPVMNEVYQALIMKTDVQKQLASNVLAGHIVNLLKGSHNVTMYSAHDIQLYLLFGAFGLTMQKPPLPTACVMIELHRNEDGKNVIKAFYLHEATGAIEALNVRGAKELAWEEFSNLATPMAKEEYEELCNSAPDQSDYDDSEKQLIAFIRTIAKQA